MFAFIFSFIFLFAGGGSAAGGGGGFADWWHTHADPYLNYPGFEAWKFMNLAIFIAIMTYLLKKPLSAAFKARREQIRAELIRAEQERRAAEARLIETESKLARLDAERTNVLTRAEREAELEKQRIAEQTEFEIRKLREQAESEITRTAQQARHELRRLSAEETIRLAEEMIKQGMTPQADARLVRSNIQAIGGLQQ
ncbi:MAG: ATP synthase F0 subunit B [Acidobacteriota bacterium]|nr:ATP synthase F0 subunit B [Acidobacteriota bacterium]